MKKLQNKNISPTFQVEDIEDYSGGLNNWLEDKLTENGFTGETLGDILTVSAEIETNILRHAYGPETQEQKKPMVVKLDLEEGEAKITFIDHGPEFNPLAENDYNFENLEQGGRGLALIKNLPDKIYYSREKGKNKLTVHFKQ
ncbi:MAG: ATP-binding protein [bacterium]